jgi:hypothetical protein
MQEYRKQVWLSYEEWTEDDVVHLLLGREPLVPFLGDMPEDWDDWLCSAEAAVRHSGLARTVTPHGNTFNPRDVIEWASRHKKEWPWFPFHSEDKVPSDVSPRKQGRAVQVGIQNEETIINELKRSGYVPEKLPPPIPGMPWVKAEIRSRVAPKFMTDRAFLKAWERLRLKGSIASEPIKSGSAIPSE